MKSIVGERLKLGLSQAQMAEAVGCPASTYNQYEKGNRSVPCDIATRIAQTLNGKVEDFFTPKWFALSKPETA